MRIEIGDSVMLRQEALEILLEQGYDLGGQVAEVVDGRLVPDGYDLTLKFEGLKTLVTDIPVQLVHHVALA